MSIIKISETNTVAVHKQNRLESENAKLQKEIVRLKETIYTQQDEMKDMEDELRSLRNIVGAHVHKAVTTQTIDSEYGAF